MKSVMEIVLMNIPLVTSLNGKFFSGHFIQGNQIGNLETKSFAIHQLD